MNIEQKNKKINKKIIFKLIEKIKKKKKRKKIKLISVRIIISDRFVGLKLI
jgi:ribosomal protein S19